MRYFKLVNQMSIAHFFISSVFMNNKKCDVPSHLSMSTPSVTLIKFFLHILLMYNIENIVSVWREISLKTKLVTNAACLSLPLSKYLLCYA